MNYEIVELIGLYNRRHPEYEQYAYIRLFDDASGSIDWDNNGKSEYIQDFMGLEQLKEICEHE
jgi:hypothetical protein